MKPNETKKKFDAVALMREIRDALSQKYERNPTSEEEDLAKVRKKYGIKGREKV